jgi:hypothetical protein
MSEATLVSAESPEGVTLEGFGDPAQQADLDTVIQQAEERRDTREAEKPQRPSRAQKRFDQFTAEKEAAIRARETAERERDDLRRQLDEARKPTPAVPPRSPEPAQSRTEPQTEPQKKPSWAEFEAKIGETYQSWGDAQDAYFDAREAYLGAHDLDARIRQSIEADRASRSRQDHVRDVAAQAKAVYADFDAVLSSPHLNDGQWPVALIDYIWSQDGAPHILYALGKDPALAARIRTASPFTIGQELAKLVPAVASSPASTAATESVTPPPPYQPVGSGSKTTSPSSADLGGDEDYDNSGYREKRRTERSRR